MSDDARHRLAIFGANGKAGRRIVETALDQEHEVTAFVRSPSAPGAFPREVRVVVGITSDPRAVGEAIRNADTVISALGHHPGDAQPFCAEATARILSAMRTQNVRRILCVTGAMIGEYPHRSFFMRKMAEAYRRRQPELARDREEQERLIMESECDWTIVKPPRLTDGPARGRVRAGTDLRVGLLSSISRRDLAAFLVSLVSSTQYSGRRVLVKG